MVSFRENAVLLNLFDGSLGPNLSIRLRREAYDLSLKQKAIKIFVTSWSFKLGPTRLLSVGALVGSSRALSYSTNLDGTVVLDEWMKRKLR